MGGVWLETAVGNFLIAYVVTYSDAIIAVFGPVVITVLGLYVFWTGYQVMSGQVENSVGAVIRGWFRYALISGIALNGPMYRTIVQQGIEGIQDAFGAALGTGPTVGAAVDGMLAPFMTITNTIWNTAMTGLAWPAFNLLFAGFFYAVAGSLMAIVALCLALIAKIMLAVLLAVGPVFIFCGLFASTQRYAENWLTMALGSVFTNVLLMATITVLASIVRTACQQALVSYGGPNPVSDSIGVLLIAASCAYVLMHVQAMASGLAGGLAIGNLGNEVGRPLAGGLGRSFLAGTMGSAGLARTLATAGLSRWFQTANNMSQRTGTVPLSLPAPGAGPPPLYQRGVIERLQKG